MTQAETAEELRKLGRRAFYQARRAEETSSHDTAAVANEVTEIVQEMILALAALQSLRHDPLFDEMAKRGVFAGTIKPSVADAEAYLNGWNMGYMESLRVVYTALLPAPERQSDGVYGKWLRRLFEEKARQRAQNDIAKTGLSGDSGPETQ